MQQALCAVEGENTKRRHVLCGEFKTGGERFGCLDAVVNGNTKCVELRKNKTTDKTSCYFWIRVVGSNGSSTGSVNPDMSPYLHLWDKS